MQLQDYCAAFCTPTVSQSTYLHTVGEKLLPGIDILWTGEKTQHLHTCIYKTRGKKGKFPSIFTGLCYVGPKVVSNKISVESIEEVSSVLKRAPVIWDNIHANDYDLQRLFLGPYKVKWKITVCLCARCDSPAGQNTACFFPAQHRPTELIPKLSGVLTNPNCEFHPNFVAIHTLATWCKAGAEGGQRDVEMGE